MENTMNMVIIMENMTNTTMTNTTMTNTTMTNITMTIMMNITMMNITTTTMIGKIPMIVGTMRKMKAAMREMKKKKTKKHLKVLTLKTSLLPISSSIQLSLKAPQAAPT